MVGIKLKQVKSHGKSCIIIIITWVTFVCKLWCFDESACFVEFCTYMQRGSPIFSTFVWSECCFKICSNMKLSHPFCVCWIQYVYLFCYAFCYCSIICSFLLRVVGVELVSWRRVFVIWEGYLFTKTIKSWGLRSWLFAPSWDLVDVDFLQLIIWQFRSWAILCVA